MCVLLDGAECGKGGAGKWTDAATGEHGDLLDVIRESCGLVDFKDVAEEARTFLSMPQPEPRTALLRLGPAPHGSPDAARRLVAMSKQLGRASWTERGCTYVGITGGRVSLKQKTNI